MTDHGGHGGHMDHGGHGDHAAQFRDRFWWSLLLAAPVVAFSSMFADLLGYTPPARAPAGSRRCSARSSSCTAAGRS